MNMQGFVKLPRELFDSPVFRNNLDFRLLILLLSNATFKDEYTSQKLNMTLKKGQYVRSYRKLQIDLIYVENQQEKMYSLCLIKASVERLTKYGYITTLRTHLGTLFTLSEALINQCFGVVEEQTLEQTLEQKNETPLNNKKNGVIKKNGIKKNDYITSSSFYDEFYLSYGKQPTPIQLQTMVNYLEVDKVEEALLTFGIKYSAKNSGAFSYLTTVLNNWIAKGIKTVEGAITEVKSRGVKTDGSKQDRKPLTDLNW